MHLNYVPESESTVVFPHVLDRLVILKRKTQKTDGHVLFTCRFIVRYLSWLFYRTDIFPIVELCHWYVALSLPFTAQLLPGAQSPPQGAGIYCTISGPVAVSQAAGCCTPGEPGGTSPNPNFFPIHTYPQLGYYKLLDRISRMGKPVRIKITANYTH